jgi:hypothetical protein
MNRWLFRLLALILLFASIFIPYQPVTAISKIEPKDVQVAFEFGQTLTITTMLANLSDNQRITVSLQPEGQSTRTEDITLDGMNLKFVYDLAAHPIPPFTRVYYWFSTDLPDGTTLTSGSFWFDYIDNRFQWRHNISKWFEINWTTEDPSLGQTTQVIALNALENATTILPVVPILPIRMYIYPNTRALQEALTLSSQEWIGGQASPEIGVILLSMETASLQTSGLDRSIGHEVMHILEFQVAGKGLSKSPVWLLEGLAVKAENHPDPEMNRVLNQAVETGSLLDIADLCHSFPVSREASIIAYAQSYSMVNYLLKKYGNSAPLSILQNSVNGNDCSQSVQKTTDRNQQQLQADWQNTNFPEYPAISIFRTWWFYLILTALLGIVLFLAIRELIYKRSHKDENA